jgi:hypothetical protein
MAKITGLEPGLRLAACHHNRYIGRLYIGRLYKDWNFCVIRQLEPRGEGLNAILSCSFRTSTVADSFITV